MTNLSSGINYNIYTKDEALEKLRESFSRIQNEIAELRKTKPDALAGSSSLKKIESKIKLESLKLSDLAELSSDLDNLKSDLVHEKTGEWEYHNSYFCKSESCKKAVEIQGKAIDLKRITEELKKENDLKSLTNEVVSGCKTSLASMSMKDYDVEEFRKVIPSVKKNFLNNVLKKFSDESKETFEKYLNDELNIVLDMGEGEKTKFFENFENNYSSETNEEDELDYSMLSAKEMLMKTLYYRGYNGKGVRPLKNLSLCEGGGITWDAFLAKADIDIYGEPEDINGDFDPTKDNILSSMLSCTHHAHGKGILAHEIGHALSRFFPNGKMSADSSKSYMKLRQCGAELHKNTKVDSSEKGSEVHKYDHYTTEEDVADIVSYIAIPDTTIIYGCALVNPLDSGEAYDDPSLENPHKMDTHSAPLMRALQEAIHKGRGLSPSCLELMDINKDKYRFTPCVN